MKGGHLDRGRGDRDILSFLMAFVHGKVAFVAPERLLLVRRRPEDHPLLLPLERKSTGWMEEAVHAVLSSLGSEVVGSWNRCLNFECVSFPLFTKTIFLRNLEVRTSGVDGSIVLKVQSLTINIKYIYATVCEQLCVWRFRAPHHPKS